MITAEKLEHHIAVLQERHDELDKQIKLHYNEYVNDEELKAEKLKKLKLKEDIESFQHQLHELTGA